MADAAGASGRKTPTHGTWDEALRAAYLDHYAGLVGYLRARTGSLQDAEDLAQDVYVRLMRMPDHARVTEMAPFLFKTARNIFIDHVRKANRRHRHHQHVLDLCETIDEKCPERIMLGRNGLQAVLRRLEVPGISATTRDIFLLHKLLGLKQREIAALRGVCIATVENHVGRARLEIARQEVTD